jgi:hypothetical protein
MTTAGSTDIPPQFFNKSGPIKIPHNRTGMLNPNASTHSQQQQVEDLFAGSSEDAILKTRGSLSKTQQISSLELGGLNQNPS